VRNRDRFSQTQQQPGGRVSPTAMVGGVAALLLVLLAAVIWFRGAGTAAAGLTSGDVALPVADFADGQARFYRYAAAGGREVRFFVMRSADGVVRAAFDTCDVCYRERKGYNQDGDTMVCNNCSQRFHSTNINELRGGCNPAPLDRRVEDGRVVITAAALNAGSWYF
jgi:uncharacterized membrane protein